MQKYIHHKSSRLLLHSLALALATTIFNCTQFLQAVQARDLSPSQSILLSQLSLEDLVKKTQNNPNDDSAWYNQGFALHELKRYQEAFDSFDKAVNLNPNHASAWYYRSFTLVELKRYQEGIDSYDKAVHLDPNNVSAWYNRGFALVELKRYQEGIDSYDKAVHLNPNNALAWQARGNALDGLKLYQQAFESYDKASQLDSSLIPWQSRGDTLYALNLYRQALESYDKASQRNPNNASVWQARGRALDGLKLYQQAFESYDKASQLDSSLMHLFDKARLLDKLKRSEEALILINFVIDKSSNDIKLVGDLNPFNILPISRFWHLKGTILLELGRFQEALIHFDKAISLNKYSYFILGLGNDIYNDVGSHDSWYGKGSTLFNLMRYQDALDAFNKAVELKPDFQDAIQARDQLKKQM